MEVVRNFLIIGWLYVGCVISVKKEWFKDGRVNGILVHGHILKILNSNLHVPISTTAFEKLRKHGHTTNSILKNVQEYIDNNLLDKKNTNLN